MNTAADRISKNFIGAVRDEWQLYSNNSSDYAIGAPIGFGASSTVYAAKYRPPDAPQPLPCALKVLDLDRLPPRTLKLLQRETQLMSLSKHPNVLRVRGSWTDGHQLYIALRLMNAGSVVDVMRFAWPEGMEEEVVKCILKQALEGLNYLHVNGLMHRDVKPANLLIDDDGTVLLGDLGVAAFLWDTEDIPPSSSTLSSGRPIARRKSFVGTPCYMAPEVINGRPYDASADIWSFGITALALTQGRAPRSLLATHTALLQTVRDAPPTLERARSGAHTYSRALQDVVARCLDKDPARRPTAQELLSMPLFRGAKRKEYLVGKVLQGLPPLVERMERVSKRKKQGSGTAWGTVDSWDFGSAAASPTTSVFQRRTGGAVSLADDHMEDEDGENEEELSVSRHARNISWAQPPHAAETSPAAVHAYESSQGGSPLSPVNASVDPVIPAAPPLSSSPSGSSSSSSIRTAGFAHIAEPAQTSPSHMGLWKRMVARLEGEHERGHESEHPQRESFSEEGEHYYVPATVRHIRRKTLSVLGRSKGVS
ncbi:uncharacterized protein FIBRA_02372 [Fibroporia radiculosa]|uniref:Protein kinase domain-containing protein n=1 Tax=Fibroporia radiculosa TaxID=599839 RepID=J4HUT7_9APHY|nr:uncharacterized protein FIBRA_02372 [Fibroporia radiculosa]CCM00342.1 predicted protein [Fibroporia radiculosa]